MSLAKVRPSSVMVALPPVRLQLSRAADSRPLSWMPCTVHCLMIVSGAMISSSLRLSPTTAKNGLFARATPPWAR